MKVIPRLAALLLFAGLFAPALCRSQTGERGVDFVVLCREGETLRAHVTLADATGVASRTLDSGLTNWAAMPDKIVDVGPVVAGNAVAVITDSFHAVYGFSKATGKQLWQRERWSSNLGSDGRYFYILRNEYWDLQAFEPETGHVAWTLKLPGRSYGGYPRLLGVHGGLLVTTQVAVDLARRKIAHTWLRGPWASSLSVNATGEIVIGDSSGGVTIYDQSFKPLRKLHLQGGAVTEAITTGKSILAVTYQDHQHGKRGLITFLTPDGKQAWQFAWSSKDPPLPPPVFALADDAAVMREPGASGPKSRLTSRNLSNGQLNWSTEEGFFFGPPVVCGNTVYARQGDLVRGYDLRTGVEKER